jgi:hypothetical protein
VLCSQKKILEWYFSWKKPSGYLEVPHPSNFSNIVEC